jgi:hypothetical protein
MSLHVSAPSPHPLGSAWSPRGVGGECAIAQALTTMTARMPVVGSIIVARPDGDSGTALGLEVKPWHLGATASLSHPIATPYAFLNRATRHWYTRLGVMPS